MGNNKSEHAKDVECNNGYLQIVALRSRIAMYSAPDLRLARVVQDQSVTVEDADSDHINNYVNVLSTVNAANYGYAYSSQILFVLTSATQDVPMIDAY